MGRLPPDAPTGTDIPSVSRSTRKFITKHFAVRNTLNCSGWDRRTDTRPSHYASVSRNLRKQPTICEQRNCKHFQNMRLSSIHRGLDENSVFEFALLGCDAT
jgi:hypothetical protein